MAELAGAAVGALPIGFAAPDKMVGYMPKKVLVAYSGGADSSLLLHLTLIWARGTGTEVIAAHVDHGIRGEEAERDREHCRKSAEALGVRCFVLREDVPKLAEAEGKSLEEAARDVRYRFFSEIMTREDIPLLLTAHNADDELETMIYRLAKGASALGLSGIPPVRRTADGRDVARPMLSLSKAEILGECEARGIDYVTDSTNSDVSYARNRIRNNILPELMRLNPDAPRAAVRTAGLIRRDNDFISSLALEYLGREDAHRIERLRSIEAPVLSRVILRMYSEVSERMLEEKHLELVMSLISEGHEGDEISLPGGLCAGISRGALTFERDKRVREPSPRYVYRLVYGEKYTDPSQFTPQIQGEDGIVYNLFTQVALEFDKIKGAIRLRERIPGDRIELGGFSKDVRKLFSEKRIPSCERADYPIVCDEDGIVWIPLVAVRSGAAAKKNGGQRLNAAVYRGRFMKGENENG